MAFNQYDIDFVHQLDPDDQEQWLLHRHACDQSLFFFIKEVGGYSIHAGGNSSPIIHKPICDLWADDSIKRKAVYMPRSWQKSTNFTKWGNIHRYCRNNEVRVLIPSQKLDLPSKFILWMEQQIMNNERLRWLYPTLQLVDKSWKQAHPFSSEECVLPREGIYSEPTFKAMGITGASQGGHYDYISPDDLIGEKGMTSAAIMEQAFNWLDLVEELLIDPLTDVISITGTHWAVGDIGHYIQESYPEFLWIIVPCLRDSSLYSTDNVTWLQNPNVDEDECNWPEKFIDEDAGEDPVKDYGAILERATEHYHKMRLNPEKQMVFYSQHMNNPRDSEITDFKSEWLRYYLKDTDDEGKTFYRYEYTTEVAGELKPKVRDCYLKDMRISATIDPSSYEEGGMSKNLANTAIVVCGVDKETNKVLVLATWAKRANTTKIFYDAVFDLHDKFRPSRWCIDESRTKNLVLKPLREEATRREKHLPATALPADVKSDAKGIRIRSLTDEFSSGKIIISKDMKALVREYLRYPMPGTKDLLDALSYHKQWWSKLNRGDLVKSNQRRYQEYVQSVS